MKLAEALALRADTHKRIEQLRHRFSANAFVQEGGTPSEDPKELLSEMENLLKTFEELVIAINNTNAQTKVGTESLTAALARRDRLGLEHSLLNGLTTAIAARSDRYRAAEIRVLPTLEIKPLRARLDDIAKTRRELDARIQEANWSTELLQ